jgi:hypothetical protein
MEERGRPSTIHGIQGIVWRRWRGLNGGGARPVTERGGGRVWVTGVPDEGPANTSRGDAHEHQQATGKRFGYLVGLEVKRRRLSTTG